jgi:transketolase
VSVRTSTPLSQRDAFTHVVEDLMVEDPRVVLVLAVIGRARFAERGFTDRFPGRMIDVGIREQTQIGVAGGLALEGLRPIVHGYAPFLVERPFEQLKLSLTHQGAGAVLVSVGGSFDASREGRTHLCPEDVALVSTLPGWEVHTPTTGEEVESVLRNVVPGTGCSYVRLSGPEGSTSVVGAPGTVVELRRGSPDSPTILAMGPAIEPTLEAAQGLDVTVLGTITPTPLDGDGLRRSVTGTDLLLVEPWLAGTSTARVADALADRPMRFHAHGITDPELPRYGSPADHAAAHGLDTAGIRARIDEVAAVATRGATRIRW